MTNELQKTPLHQWHRDHGARMVPFAGWDMPVQYTSILEEHTQTRKAASIFDISHMGEFLLTGEGAAEALGQVVTHNLDTLKPGRCRYGFLLQENGGILDDLIVYRLAEDRFMLVVNAACIDTDFSWLTNHLPASLTLTDQSAQTAKIDLQGPASYAVLKDILPGSWAELGYFAFEQTTFVDKPLLVSRTGYTGELGYELYVPQENALALWELFAGHQEVQPAGLGARDTLRLEAGLPLYGQDLDKKHTPEEAGYAMMLTSAQPYIGKKALGSPKEQLIGLRIEGRRSARHHDEVLLDEQPVGVVTSGSFAPSLGYCIALAYVRADVATRAEFNIKTARTTLNALRVAPPFYTQGSARTKLS